MSIGRRELLKKCNFRLLRRFEIFEKHRPYGSGSSNRRIDLQAVFSFSQKRRPAAFRRPGQEITPTLYRACGFFGWASGAFFTEGAPDAFFGLGGGTRKFFGGFSVVPSM
jgi:hypothetical protein